MTTYAGDEFYDDDVTSGPVELPKRRRATYEHVQPYIGRDHVAEPAPLAPRMICRRCGRPIRRIAA